MERIVLNYSSWAMTVLPELGGKICSLRNRSTGWEWLWSNPYLALRLPRYGESYIKDLDFGGWDDLFPSITPGRIGLEGDQWMEVPDHGDLAHLSWSIEEATEDSLVLSVKGRCMPFRYTRTIRVSKAGFLIEYSLINEGRLTFPWLWSAHALLVVKPGMRFRWLDRERVERGTLIVPNPESPVFEPYAEKRFSDRGTVSEVECLSPDGADRLRLSFNADVLPYLGLWLNFGGWSGSGSAPYFNLGIEPTTAPTDDLSDAITEGNHRLIRPGESVDWTVEIQCI